MLAVLALPVAVFVIPSKAHGLHVALRRRHDNGLLASLENLTRQDPQRVSASLDDVQGRPHNERVIRQLCQGAHFWPVLHAHLVADIARQLTHLVGGAMGLLRQRHQKDHVDAVELHGRGVQQPAR